MSESVLPMFYTKGFTVSGLRVTSLIHFEFILCDVRVYFNFSLLHVTVQFAQHHLLKILSSLHCLLGFFGHRLGDRRCVGLSGLSVLFH